MSKVTLKILQARLQQFMNHEIPDVQAVFRKGRGTRDQTANIHWIIEKAREFQGKKKSTSASLTMPKSLTVWITTNCGKFLEMGILDHLTCLQRNLYAGQETTVRTGHGTRDWFQIEKGLPQSCVLSPRLFKFYTRFISDAQSCLTLCNPMKCSTPGFPVYHQLLELTQTHVYRVSDAIQPSHPRSSPSPPDFNLFQHQGLFKQVSSSHQMAKELEFQLQHQSFQ